jgi:hypothetical protein
MPEQDEPSHANHSMLVCQIVGRCHVGESNRKVLRYFIGCLREGMITWRALTRETRREFMKGIFECHSANRGLYRFVTRGNHL